MRINTVVQPKDVEPAVDWVSGLIGTALDKRVAAFKAQERSNPLLVTHFRDTFGLDFALAEARKYRRTTADCPRVTNTTTSTAFSLRLIGFTQHCLLKCGRHSRAGCETR